MKTLLLTTAGIASVFSSLVLGSLFHNSLCSTRETWKVLAGKASVSTKETKERLARLHVNKTEDGLDLWATPQGPIWTVHGERSLAFLLWEVDERDIYEPGDHQVHAGDVVLDCGANIGVFTRKALSRGARLVVAIEPAPQTLAALRRNLAAEIESGRVVVYPQGVWDSQGEIEMATSEANEAQNSMVIRLKESNGKVRVPLTTIDRIVTELKLASVDFIKMDIEGAEKPALKGAAETIRRFRPRMSISSEHLSDDVTAIPALVGSIDPGYRHSGCDCHMAGDTVKPDVIAFDPL